MSDNPSPGTAPDGTPSTESPDGSGVGMSTGDVGPASGARLTKTIAGRLGDQARRTASAARAGRVVTGDEPGVLDLTPLRELLAELVDELRQLRLRDRVAQALRQAADIIGTEPPEH